MNERLRLLALRRESLVVEADAQRAAVAAEAMVWSRPGRVASGALAAIKAHPLWTLGAAAALLALRPRGVLRWAGRGWMALQAWQAFQAATKATKR